MDDLAIQRLVNFKLKVLTGMVTDWPGEQYHHMTSMTCSVLADHRCLLPTWKTQLAELLHNFRIVPE